MERKNRKILVGKVVSDKTDKTIVVAISTWKNHPLYGKRVESTTKFAAHDESNEAHVGDTVRIVGTRPLSKTKHFRLLEIIERADNA